MPEVDATLTIAPPPWASMTGRTCLQVRKTLLRLTAICLSQTSSAISTGPPAAEPPTLLTRTSMRPNSRRQASTARATEAASVTSHSAVAKRPPSSRMRSAVSSMDAGFRSTPKTSAPSCANRTAAARPLPQPAPTDPAPVIIATLPWSLPAMVVSLPA